MALGLELALLGFLREGPLHAYELHTRLSQAEALGLVWHVKQGSLYAQLAKLEAAGYIHSETEHQGNRPPRKVLSPTPSGQLAFDSWIAAPVEHGRDFRIEFLAKLYFASRTGPAATSDLIERQRAACHGWLSSLRGEADHLRAGAPYNWLVYEFRRGQIEAILCWLDTCETALAALAPV